MTVTIGNYTFEGAFLSPASLEDKSGVYAVLGAATDGLKLLDVGESGWVKTRVSCHDRASDWSRQGLPLSYTALYCDERTRMRIEGELRAQFRLPCGVR